MREIEKRMLSAVKNGRNMREGNTQVQSDGANTLVLLHGSIIYREDAHGRFFTLAGWNTTTTRSRLRALGVGVSCKNFAPIYNGEVINACEWYAV